MSLSADFWHFFRISALGATATLPLLGAASTDPRLPLRRAAGLLGVAVCFHAFVYIHNDLCDLELDRGQPLRAAYPLVRGAISPGAALAVALACVPAAFALHELFVREPQRARKPEILALGGAFGLLAAYNRWGKRCQLPPLTDALQGLGWAALIWYGAAAVGQPGRFSAALALYELLLIMLVNGVHGGLRDLAGDTAFGARTTARLLGARADGGALQVTPALAGYAAALQAAMLGVLGRAVAANLADHTPAQRAWAAAGAILPAAGLSVLLAAARRGAGATDLGMLHLILILSAPVAVAAPGTAPGLRAALLAAHLLPLLINRMTYDALLGLVAALGRAAPPPPRVY